MAQETNLSAVSGVFRDHAGNYVKNWFGGSLTWTKKRDNATLYDETDRPRLVEGLQIERDKLIFEPI